MRTANSQVKRWILILLIWLPTISASLRGADSMWFEQITLPYEANIVNYIFQDTQGMIWLGTKRGLFTYDGYTAHRIAEGNIHAIESTDERTLCFGDDSGLHWLDMQTEQLISPFGEDKATGEVRSLLYHKDRLYVGTRTSGLYCLNLRDCNWTHYPTSSQQNSIVFAIEAYDKDIYIGHYGGLSRLSDDGKIYDCRISDNVYAVRYDETDRQLWIGTEHNLLCRNPKTGETTCMLEQGTINRIEIAPSGELLLASEQGLCIYNKRDQSTRMISHDAADIHHSIPNNNIHYILLDRQQNIWIATDRGIAVTESVQQFQSISLADLFHTHEGNLFSRILVDSQGDRWLGGDNGLILLSERGNKWFRTDNGLRKNTIRSIYEDRSKDIWIATDAGIAHYNRTKEQFDYYQLTDSKGRNANWAYDIYEDIHQRLWVATYMGGLFLVNKKDLLASNGHYTMRNLPFEKDDETVCSIFRFAPESDSLLWVSTKKGLASINIETLEVSLKEQVYLDQMIVIGSRIWLDEQGKLSYFDRVTNQRTDADFQLEDATIHCFVKENNHLWLSTSKGIYYSDLTLNTLHTYGIPSGQFTVGAFDAARSELLWGGEDFICTQSLSIPISEAAISNVFITNITVQGTNFSSLSPRFTKTLRLPGREDVCMDISSLSYEFHQPKTYWYRFDKDGEWHTLPYGSNRITLMHLSGGSYTLYLTCKDPLISNDYSQYTLIVPYPWYLRMWAWCIYAGIILLMVYILWQYLKQRAQQRLEQQEREQVMALTQQKMDFFVNMSHELKTPLSLIIAPLSKLLSETSNARLRENLKNIYANSMRLNELISRILEVKQLEVESEDQLLTSRAELCALIQHCIHEFDDLLASSHTKITFKTDKETIWMDVDAVKISTSIRNLLSNAIKYADKEQGSIEVRLNIHEEEVEISVHDNGQGINEDEISKVFNRYYQGSNAKSGSSGIGLSLVKRYTEMHHGHVKAENDSGLKVSIFLPRVETLQIETETPIQEGPLRAKILIVDDNPEILDFLTQALSHNYCCFTASNGEEALSAVNTDLPDLIITDQMMPGMDGTELCSRLRHEHATSLIPIILLTAKDDSFTEMESLRIGVDIFMPKPFDLRKLQLHIVQLLHKRKAIEQEAHIHHITQETIIHESPLTGDEALMERITHLILENMHKEEFNVSMLVRILGMDQKQVYRKIKQLTGQTPVSYIRQKRMQHAAQLLSQHRFTISEIVYQVGFSNASYFTKCFTSEFGISPSEYAERGKQTHA